MAVKVRHPGVEQAIQRDFELLTWTARVAKQLPFLQNICFEETLNQFAGPLREQVISSSLGLSMGRQNE